MFFKCKHPASWLIINKPCTTEIIDKDFTQVTYHLLCRKCDKTVDIGCVELINGVDEFLSQGIK